MIHGTDAGWQAHRRHKTEPCDACRRAHADYQRHYRYRKGQSQPVFSWAQVRMFVTGGVR